MNSETQNAVEYNTAAFFSFVNHPLKFRLYLLKNLPAAFFSGVRLVRADGKECIVAVPYKHFTRNPFGSTYFACLSMAAEMSTGLLAMANIYKRRPAVSMLITGMEALFHKKATGLTLFTCSDGAAISHAIGTAMSTRQSQKIKAYSIGKNARDEMVAEFWFTWSFKAK